MQVSRGGCPQQSLNFAVVLAASGGGGGSGRKGGLDDQRWRRDWSADRIRVVADVGGQRSAQETRRMMGGKSYGRKIVKNDREVDSQLSSRVDGIESGR